VERARIEAQATTPTTPMATPAMVLVMLFEGFIPTSLCYDALFEG
jgi:hypothetical protein